MGADDLTLADEWVDEGFFLFGSTFRCIPFIDESTGSGERERFFASSFFSVAETRWFSKL
jgi:hypothetical protein